MGILSNLISRFGGADHETYYIQAPLFQRQDGTCLNDNRGSRKNGFLRVETWRVTQDEDVFGQHINVGFNMEEPIKPGARLSVVIQPEHVTPKTIEKIRGAIFRTFGIDGAESSKEEKQKVRGGYATLVMVVKAAKNKVTPKDGRFDAYYQLTVSEVVDWEIHYCTRKSDAGLDLHAPLNKSVMGGSNAKELKEALKKEVPNITFKL